MSETRNRSGGFPTLLAMIGVLVLPVTLTLQFADKPCAYTWSLSLFVVPSVVIAAWFLRKPDRVDWRAFRRSIVLLVPLGCVLDYFFGGRFFKFENKEATLGFTIPAWDGTKIPVEEYIFYASGFIFVLLLYVWSCEYWLAAYEPPKGARSRREGPIVRFHAPTLWVGASVIAGGFLYRRFFASELDGGPWYLVFLVVASVVPSLGFFRSCYDSINWRAFSFTFFAVLLISLFWEVTLGIPYKWWDYQSSALLGIRVTAWHSLPLEAAYVWFAVTFTSVIIYEAVQLYLASGRSFSHAFFGERGR